jgi:peptidoglycan biosynthesis protein MviN/MurJ (putative lipid II flippase)
VGWLVQALFFASILQVVASPTAQAAKALGEVRAPLIAGVVSLIVQILILTFTYKSLGLTSYPLAAAIGGCCSTGLILYRVARRIDGVSLASLVPVMVSCLLAGTTWWLVGRYAGAQPVLIIAGLISGGLVYVASLLLLAGAQVSRYIGVIAETTAKNQPTLMRVLNWISSTTTSLDMVARMRTRAGGVQFR